MAVVVNEFEVAPQAEPAREAQAEPRGKQADRGGSPLPPEALRQFQKTIHVSHERKRRLAVC